MRNIRIVLIGLFGVLLFFHVSASASFSYSISLTQDYLYNTVSLQFYNNGEPLESFIQSSFSTEAGVWAYKYGYQVYALYIGQSYNQDGYISVYWGKDAYPYHQDDYWPYTYSIEGYTEADYTLMISGDPGFVLVDYEKTYSDSSYFVGWTLPQIGFGAPFNTDIIGNPPPHYQDVQATVLLEIGKAYHINTYYDFTTQPPGGHTGTLQILDVRSVPEPATMLLLGSGLLGLWGARRRFRK